MALVAAAVEKGALKRGTRRGELSFVKREDKNKPL
jgi:hypothetical protein